MDKPISVGDLVVVVRTCCPKRDELGAHFRVASISAFMGGEWGCKHCDAYGYDSKIIAEQHYGPKRDSKHAPLGWLKRIPPMEELEGEKRDEKLREPA